MMEAAIKNLFKKSQACISICFLVLPNFIPSYWAVLSMLREGLHFSSLFHMPIIPRHALMDTHRSFLIMGIS